MKKAHDENCKAPHPRSLDGVAERNGVCRGTLYNEARRGNLRITKIGRRSIITEASEEAWLARNQLQEA